MIKKLLLAVFMVSSLGSFAQDERIEIKGNATVELPADQVLFSVNLNYKDYDQVKKAFDMHKEAESQLTKLLKDLKIDSKKIQYDLIRFEKSMEYRATGEPKEYFSTHQNVQFLVTDIKKYPNIMMDLVNKGFTNVSTTFVSSKEESAQNTLLEKAIKDAKSKAEVLAKASSRKLGKVTKISEGMPVSHEPIVGFAMAKTEDALISEFPQTVKKEITLFVTFTLE